MERSGDRLHPRQDAIPFIGKPTQALIGHSRRVQMREVKDAAVGLDHSVPIHDHPQDLAPRDHLVSHLSRLLGFSNLSFEVVVLELVTECARQLSVERLKVATVSELRKGHTRPFNCFNPSKAELEPARGRGGVLVHLLFPLTEIRGDW